ncbi:thiamine phosphate synthase [Sulfidibacter corallicola]|uniref:Thiamine-phosphate synthase n=1 Tax=Sulfidibacter corallicola TaxID=2818388 RepID=A0A8A4TWK8_SULCO|nr:bifunctional hydroxymethylpyrimidine kinase/phosphomethylpyrimidine kinase [Sulfidibacter corallicola]QTD53571.1 bifunctional hydroxymethylpyrimidine kinase/phosphomethylpyrimidine kinase [Sulfidibacter corallicola]
MTEPSEDASSHSGASLPSLPVCWTIAGSDSGGGAGIQADLKTFFALGVHGCSVITALTAQNTRGVAAVALTEPSMLDYQWQALVEDLPAAAIKLGMLGDAAVIRAVAERLNQTDAFVVLDPVMVATSGSSLMAPEARSVMVETLFPRADLITPNLPEAEALLGRRLRTPAQVEHAAVQLRALGARAVLIKGGHGDAPFSQDHFSDGTASFWLTGPRIETPHTHGSGCTLSAAIAAAVALGYELADALVIGKAFITAAIRDARPQGSGPGPVLQGAWPEREADLPWMTSDAESGRNRLRFPDCGPRQLGFYPIVDRVAWMKRLLPLGVSTIQLRIKDLTGAALENEIHRAVELSKHYNCRLFVNDYWELALRFDAYGVHLGQEDLPHADLARLCKAGLRLGVSTHCYYEVARALAVHPSYMAIGPVFSTQTKVMRFAPQGLAALARWRRSLGFPLVAIGGIKLNHVDRVLAAGADSIAVITAITEAEDPEGAARQWLQCFE